MCDNKQPDAAVPDTADTDTEPLTSEIGHPVSEGDIDTEPLTPETGQPISERDTDTTTRLSDTHVLESPCGSDGPTRRLRSKSVNTAKEKRQLTARKRVHVCFERYKQHAQAANFKIGTRPGPCLG